MARFSGHINMDKFTANKVPATPDVDKVQKHTPLYGGWVLYSEHMQAAVELYHRSGGAWVCVAHIWLKEDEDNHLSGYFIGKHSYMHTATLLALESAGFSFSNYPTSLDCIKSMSWEFYTIMPFGRV